MEETRQSTRTQMFSKRRTVSFQFKNFFCLLQFSVFIKTKKRGVTVRQRVMVVVSRVQAVIPSWEFSYYFRGSRD